jgi:hypothetical protein
MPDTDAVAAELAAIRRRAEQITSSHGDPGEEDSCDLNGETCTGHDAERLLAGYDALLALHVKTPLYALSVREFDNHEPPRVWCGHSCEETENSRHVVCDSGDVVCLDKPEGDVCGDCRDGSGEAEEWPCSTVLAISAALLGEEADRG